MKVVHIIPTAFNYFDNIKFGAFELVEQEQKLGAEAKVLTLQYETVSEKEKKILSGPFGPSPSCDYQGTMGAKQAFSSLNEYDLIHLHCPFLGAAGKILQWRRLNPRKPFVVSFYEDVIWTDFTSLFVILYNRYYLPKIISSADFVLCLDEENAKKVWKKYTKGRRNIALVNIGKDEKHLTNNSVAVKLNNKTVRMSVEKIMSVYDFLLENNKK